MNYKEELNKVGKLLIKKQHSVAIAESVTAGLIQNVFSNLDNAASFYEGGITAYNIRQKMTHLFVDPIHAIGTNCVSEKIAGEMAQGICRSFKSNWGIAVTGYATPVPEMGIHELFACFAICYNHKIIRSSTISVEREEPEKVQHAYMMAVVKSFIDCCRKIEANDDINKPATQNNT
jgi:nicotinamide-nucleotide amidase